MKSTASPGTARAWSWVLGAAAVVVPAAVYGWQAHTFSQWAETQPGPVCGMPLLGALLFSALLSGALSLTGLAVGVAAFHKLAKPLTRRRMVELIVIGSPAVLLMAGLLITAISDVSR